MRWSWQRTRFVREVLGLMGYLNWAKWGGREQFQTQGNSSLITLVSTYFDEASHQPSNPSNPSQIITNPWIFGWIVIDQDTPPRPSTSRVGRELRRGAINSDWSRAFSSLNTSRWRFRCFSDAGVRPQGSSAVWDKALGVGASSDSLDAWAGKALLLINIYWICIIYKINYNYIIYMGKNEGNMGQHSLKLWKETPFGKCEGHSIHVNSMSKLRRYRGCMFWNVLVCTRGHADP